MTPFELSVHFFLQLAVLLITCRLVEWFARRLGQPPVVSEMIAGVVLGPSLVGALFPDLGRSLFPKESMPILYAVAQVGVALYMFLVGVEFRTDRIRGRVKSAVSVSVAGMLTPFVLGATLSVFLYRDPDMFTARVSPGEAALYLGAAMSITAFPMLARIVHEQGLTGTSLGTLALAAGSLDDAAAWCVLAVVLASFSGAPLIAVAAVGGGVLYALTVIFLVRPLLRPLGARVEKLKGMSPSILAGVLSLVMLGSWLTDSIGIYAVFGAFIMGTAMPRGRFADELQRLVGPLTTSLLVPLFFVYSGLNTRIGLVDNGYRWGITGLIFAAACIGKGVACFLAARANGEPMREAAGIGALMNARGLMELIILNIGYERGLISQTLFTMMVVMAVVTTLMASPLFEAFYPRALRERGQAL